MVIKFHNSNLVSKFRCVYVDKAFAHSREEVNAMTQCSVVDHNFNAGRSGTGKYDVVYSVQLKGYVYIDMSPVTFHKYHVPSSLRVS